MMTAEDARRAIDAAVALYPNLDALGFPRPRDPRRVPFGDEDLDMVATAAAYLARMRPTHAARINSYLLKHAAEEWGHDAGMSPYVTNGCLIVAALALGLIVAPVPNSPNARVGVARVGSANGIDDSAARTRRGWPADGRKHRGPLAVGLAAELGLEVKSRAALPR